MTEANYADTGGAANGCRCGSQVAAAPPKEATKTGCCDDGHDHAHNGHHTDGGAAKRNSERGEDVRKLNDFLVDPAGTAHQLSW
jgi:hypothetical protein